MCVRVYSDGQECIASGDKKEVTDVLKAIYNKTKDRRFKNHNHTVFTFL